MCYGNLKYDYILQFCTEKWRHGAHSTFCSAAIVLFKLLPPEKKIYHSQTKFEANPIKNGKVTVLKLVEEEEEQEEEEK